MKRNYKISKTRRRISPQAGKFPVGIIKCRFSAKQSDYFSSFAGIYEEYQPNGQQYYFL